MAAGNFARRQQGIREKQQGTEQGIPFAPQFFQFAAILSVYCA